MGTVQQTLAVDLLTNQVIFSDTGSIFKYAVSGASALIIDFGSNGGSGQVAFTADFSGKILTMELDPGQTIIMHKQAFLCAEKSVSLDIFFTRKLGAGLFGGEGFILQKLIGPDMAFAEFDGEASWPSAWPNICPNLRVRFGCKQIF